MTQSFDLIRIISPWMGLLFSFGLILAALWFFTSNKNSWSILFLIGSILTGVGSLIFSVGSFGLSLLGISGREIFSFGSLFYLLGGLLKTIGILGIARSYAMLNQHFKREK